MLSFKLAPDVLICRKEDGALSLTSKFSNQQVVVKNPPLFLLNCLEKLQNCGADEEALVGLAKQKDLPKCYYFLELLKKNNLLSLTIIHENKPLLTTRPLSSDIEYKIIPSWKREKVKLSKFALFHAGVDGMILETPLAPVQCQIPSDEILTLLYKLAKPHLFKEIRSSLPQKVLEHIFLHLLSLQILVICAEEEDDPFALQWELHDLFFHSRSRLGRHNNPYGGIYPFKTTISPLSVCKPPLSSRSIPLFRPDIEKLKREDKPLTQIIEERRSLREHANKSITLKQLGEFLFRTARIKEIKPGELSSRPYPAGGAIYELELYLAAMNCQGLKKDIYHYHPQKHALFPTHAPAYATDRLTQDAMRTSGMQRTPQVLIVITSRFQRMSWKYRSMAYATTLKNTGVLLQTMYLVATAMELAPCAIGGGNADLFAKVIGTNYLEESSVGEFMLGTKGQDGPYQI